MSGWILWLLVSERDDRDAADERDEVDVEREERVDPEREERDERELYEEDADDVLGERWRRAYGSADRLGEALREYDRRERDRLRLGSRSCRP